MRTGKIYLLITAVIYGIIPVFTKQVQIGGGNGVTLVFLRSALCLPLLFLYIRAKGKSLALTKKQFSDTAVLSLFANAPAMVLLYSAFGRASVGSASMLHFVYPFLIVAVSAVFFKKRISVKKWFGVFLAFLGVAFSLDLKTDAIGAVLALLSGAFYAFFVIYLDRSGADRIDYWVLTFYLSLGMAVSSFLMALFGEGLAFPQSFTGAVSAITVSVLTTFVAIPLFQRGVKAEGAEEAGLLSMAEPVTSILLGVIFLGEKLTVRSVLGVILMGLGLIF